MPTTNIDMPTLQKIIMVEYTLNFMLTIPSMNPTCTYPYMRQLKIARSAAESYDVTTCENIHN